VVEELAKTLKGRKQAIHIRHRDEGG